MSKASPSNLARDQYDLLSDLLPAAKPGGRPRKVEMWEILNAIFYVLVEGVRWRALPGDFPAWQTVYTYFSQLAQRWHVIADPRPFARVDTYRGGS